MQNMSPACASFLHKFYVCMTKTHLTICRLLKGSAEGKEVQNSTRSCAYRGLFIGMHCI